MPTCPPARVGGHVTRRAQLRQAGVTLAWLSPDPEPTAIPRHGPLLVQRGHVLLFQHSQHHETLQVRSPCHSPARPWPSGPPDKPVVQQGPCPHFLGEKTWQRSPGCWWAVLGPLTILGLPPRGMSRAYPLSPETNHIPCSEQALESRSSSGGILLSWDASRQAWP